MGANRRRIITHIATSADGYIARSDGDVGWLDRPQPKGNYGMNAFVRSIDTILWGRNTYEMALGFGGLGMFGETTAHYVFTNHPRSDAADGVQFVSEPVPAFARRLRARKGKDIWMMGGAELIGSFLDASEIDEFVIHVIPVFIGEGIPLVAPRHRNIELEMLGTKRYSDGVVRLHYRVKPATKQRRKSSQPKS